MAKTAKKQLKGESRTHIDKGTVEYTATHRIKMNDMRRYNKKKTDGMMMMAVGGEGKVKSTLDSWLGLASLVWDQVGKMQEKQTKQRTKRQTTGRKKREGEKGGKLQ